MAAGDSLALFESDIYRKTILNSGNMIAIIDKTYTYLFASRLFTHYLGLKKTNIIGHAVPEIIGEELFWRKLKPNIDKSLQGKSTAFEISLSTSRMGERFIFLKCYPVTEKGIRTVMVLATDITRLKRHEQSLQQEHRMYRIVLEKATDILLIMDPDGVIISASRYVDRQTGLSSKSILGQSVRCILTPRSFEIVVKHLDEWKSHHARNHVWEAEVINQGGKPVPFELRSTPVYEQGRLKWVVAIARNISERKSIEEKLQQSYKDLEERLKWFSRESREELRKMSDNFKHLSNQILEDQEREKNAIGRELHDEMGGYLTILGIYLSKMAKDPGNKAWQEQFTQAFDEMVQYIRSLSHSLYPVMLERGDLLAALMTYFDNYQRRVGIKVVFKYRGMQERLPSHIEVVAYRIIQEALTNVAKHAEAEMVKITISRLKYNIKIFIEDNGRGFDISRIKTEGAYGISGMKNRALFAGGNLVVNSIPGHGTNIVCILPIVQLKENRPPFI